MNDINRLLKDYYYANGTEKYKQGERWTTEHYNSNKRDIRRNNAWKDLLTLMNEIRNTNPEIQFSYDQRQMAKDIVYSISYDAGHYDTKQISLIIIVYIFNWIYERNYNFSKYLNYYDLDKRKVDYFILKYIKKIGG